MLRAEIQRIQTEIQNYNEQYKGGTAEERQRISMIIAQKQKRLN